MWRSKLFSSTPNLPIPLTANPAGGSGSISKGIVNCGHKILTVFQAMYSSDQKRYFLHALMESHEK
jgi:hypothetical protein